MSRRSRVVSTGKNAAWVVLDDEHVPRVATLRRQAGKRFMPVPGDVAFVTVLEDESTVIDRLEPRAFELHRRTFEGRSKVMAANVDAMATVTALADPPPRTVVLDQLLAFAQLEGLDAVPIFTKPDLVPAAERDSLPGLYTSLGYRTITCDPKHRDHMDEVRSALEGRRTLLCGVSGVGKSSIFTALGGEAVIGAVSRRGIGRQTTSAARLYRLPGGFLIDSPGVAEFGLGAITARELVPGFREMAERAQRCRFSDCTHLHEPDCAVRAAVDRGEIALSRYASYRRILGAP